MTALDVLTRVERHGGELGIRKDGRLVLRNPRNVPANLRDDIARHKVALREAILARTGAAQLPLDLPATSGPLDFWARQDRRFDRLLREYGIPVEGMSQTPCRTT